MIEQMRRQSPSSAKREPLYKGLVHSVRKRIELGQLAPGTRAPSESDLIAEFRVSSTTARRCLNDLAQAGYVERVQGKGTFVRPPPALVRCRQIGLLYNELFSLANVFQSQILKGIGSTLDGGDFQPTLVASAMVRRSPDPGAALLELVRRQEIEGLLILSPMPLAWLKAVLDAGMPVASINFEYTDDRIASAVPEGRSAFHRLVQRLREAGHRRVVSVSRIFPPELLEGVRLQPPVTEVAGVQWLSEEFRYFQDDQTAQIVKKRLAGAEPPTAFVARGYEQALEIRETVQAQSLRVPEDISVLFLGVPPGPTTLSGEIAPVEEMARWAAKRVSEAIASGKGLGRPAPVQTYPTRFNAGVTIAPGPHA